MHDRNPDWKPIPTWFMGVLHRSRTEARWAICLEVLGFKREYELEGFALGAGWYLPDFYLPGLRMWIEVKPTDFYPDEIRKCRELAAATGCEVFMVVGSPEVREYPCCLPGGGIVALDLAAPDRMAMGAAAARAARFEHGAKPEDVLKMFRLARTA